jgi:hypothetical protein
VRRRLQQTTMAVEVAAAFQPSVAMSSLAASRLLLVVVVEAKQFAAAVHTLAGLAVEVK